MSFIGKIEQHADQVLTEAEGDPARAAASILALIHSRDVVRRKAGVDMVVRMAVDTLSEVEHVDAAMCVIDTLESHVRIAAIALVGGTATAEERESYPLLFGLYLLLCNEVAALAVVGSCGAAVLSRLQVVARGIRDEGRGPQVVAGPSNVH